MLAVVAMTVCRPKSFQRMGRVDCSSIRIGACGACTPLALAPLSVRRNPDAATHSEAAGYGACSLPADCTAQCGTRAP